MAGKPITWGQVRVGPMFLTVAGAQRLAGLIGALAKEPGWRTTIRQYQIVEEALECLADKYHVQVSPDALAEYKMYKARHAVQDWSIDLKKTPNPMDEAKKEFAELQAVGWVPGMPLPWEKKSG